MVDPSTQWLEERMKQRLSQRFDWRWVLPEDPTDKRSRSRSLSGRRHEDPHKKKEKAFAENLQKQVTTQDKPVSKNFSEDPMAAVARDSDSWLMKAPPGTTEAQGQGISHTEHHKPPKKKKRQVEDEEDVFEWREKVPQKVQRGRVHFDAGAESSDEEVGPMPLTSAAKTAISQAKGSYGGYLLAGEGDAMANFVQSNQRIPRRGEVGIKADAIEELEELGFVMSGSRHRRMNAVRIRKENQVYSAEEKRALAMYQFEEKASRETSLITDLRDMLQKRQQTISEGASEDPRFNSMGQQKKFV